MLMESQVLHAKKLGLPDVILPNDVRNDLYVTIASGELTKCKLKLIRIIIVTKKIKIGTERVERNNISVYF